MATKRFLVLVLVGVIAVGGSIKQAFADTNTDIIRNGLLGAGVGAISAEASGGKAGKGALIGAGTNVIGGALLNVFFPNAPSQTPTYAQPTYAQPSYAQPSYYSQPAYTQQTYYQPTYQPQQVVYVQQPQVRYVRRQEPVYYQSAPSYGYSNQGYRQTDPNRQIIRNGLLGAGVGAIAAEVSGGKAGTGALVGAGSSVIGEALISVLVG